MNTLDKTLHQVNGRTRRQWLGMATRIAALGPGAWPGIVQAAPMSAPAAAPLTRRIPSSGEALPVVGLGSWITFNVGGDLAARDACTDVIRTKYSSRSCHRKIIARNSTLTIAIQNTVAMTFISFSLDQRTNRLDALIRYRASIRVVGLTLRRQ